MFEVHFSLHRMQPLLPGPFTDSSWIEAMQPEINKPYFKKLCEFVDNERQTKKVYPPSEDIFSAFNTCPLDKVKVVIVGQDPYHQPGQAHGLAFSVRPNVPTPPSLKNIYKELEEDIPGFKIPKHGYLQHWADQGVLLLNAVLTVVESSANAHKDKGWENFTGAAISAISEKCENVVFILWGNYAKKRKILINVNKHLVLEGGHPSPLSYKYFKGCKHFSKTNEYLVENGKTPIDWQIPE